MQLLSWEDLYERVWAEPMIKVAAEFGVSGTALKKTCNRHDIPTPNAATGPNSPTANPSPKTHSPN